MNINYWSVQTIIIRLGAIHCLAIREPMLHESSFQTCMRFIYERFIKSSLKGAVQRFWRYV